MKVKKFRGESINDAVAQMKNEFGSEAVILHTKKVKEGGFLGFFGTKLYEVIGAVDPNVNQPVSPILTRNETSKNQAQTLISDRTHWNTAIQELYRQLKMQEIPHTLALEIVKSVLSKISKEYWNDSVVLQNQLRMVISSYILVEPPWELTDEPKVAVMVGPTGVGKTTTIAKLAANYHLIANKRVGLVTMDTYRIAAVDQLRTYADIINVPLRVAYTVDELEAAIQSLQDMQLILIDTSGRSHLNLMQMSELQAALKKINAETYLVLSATTKSRDLTEIINAFKTLGIDNLIITKLDETQSYGILIQAANYANAPISFITTGQSVPDDIEIAAKSNFINLILGEWS